MIAKSMVFLIKLYQYLLSPLLGNNCRFYPTCSEYTIQALKQHGCLCGSFLAVKRICKCQPFHSGGLDPVPDTCLKTPRQQNPEPN
ncbi:MAG: membrane protein insertion efficiency factor YidD [Gammaproteobacteria bacterium]|nr:membrane protein insertion efficiency factor YidD [Gammaproteobacteria bacterium]MBQ0839270.1 membrane protein insertion efficiency factor YidD [Gammaproteobacteria bacterium]